MRTLLNKIPNSYKIIIISVVIVLAVVVSLFSSGSNINNETVKVEKLAFSINVSGEGEISALKNKRINAPDLLNNYSLRIWHAKIIDLVPEGTKVKEGDFIAKLDPTDVENRLKETMERIEEYSNSLVSAKLDSTIVLTNKRVVITNNLDAVEECKIKLTQAKYESKATQRKAAIALQKAELALKTSKRNYQKEIQRQKNKVERLVSSIKSFTEKRELYIQLKKEYRITSPSTGLVVYAKKWGSKKIKINDHVSGWNPQIANIPDLSSLVSIATIKEIDISKIKLNQKTSLTIDAFPDKIFTGKVIRIANIGQPIKGAGMNGFKVTIRITNADNKLLPGMTTFNNITISEYSDELILPREAVFSNDSIQFVYIKNGSSFSKKTITTGGENETHIRVAKGLNEGDIVSLVKP